MDGELSTDQGIIEGCISNFHRQLYSETEVHRPILDEVVFSSISEEDATWLDRPFDEDEVFGVVNEFNNLPWIKPRAAEFILFHSKRAFVKSATSEICLGALLWMGFARKS